MDLNRSQGSKTSVAVKVSGPRGVVGNWSSYPFKGDAKWDETWEKFFRRNKLKLETNGRPLYVKTGYKGRRVKITDRIKDLLSDDVFKHRIYEGIFKVRLTYRNQVENTDGNESVASDSDSPDDRRINSAVAGTSAGAGTKHVRFQKPLVSILKKKKPSPAGRNTDSRSVVSGDSDVVSESEAQVPQVLNNMRFRYVPNPREIYEQEVTISVFWLIAVVVAFAAYFVLLHVF